MSDFPRDDLIRMTPFDAASIELRAEGDGNEMVGYGAIFNTDTIINGWEGHFVERIAHGAFRKTLEERGNRVKIQFDHGMDTRFGGAPIAVPIELREDDKGLLVRARFVDTEAGREARELIRSGAVDGMSFRFSVTREDEEIPAGPSELPIRTIREVKLYEVGPVTFPAYEATTVGVRSAEALRLLRIAGVQSSDPSDAADSGTSDESSDTPPVEAPVGAHKKRVEQARRRLARQFPEIGANHDS